MSDYASTSVRRGRKPLPSDQLRVNLGIRLSISLRDQIIKTAEQNGITVTSFIERSMMGVLENLNKHHGERHAN